VRLTLLGPMPPPINGQSVVMNQMVSELEPHFAVIRIVDTSEGKAVGRLRLFRKILRSATALSGVRGSDAVYIAVKAGHGMWLTTAAAGLARSAGARVFLHHHSYSYVRERKPRMVALTRAAGPLAHHIVLSHSMLRDLGNVMPEIHRVLIIGNAGLVDSNLLDLPLKSDGRGLVLGHLSNLTLDKGIAEVVDLAVALHRAGTQIRLVVAGPTADEESRLQLSRASVELGELFEYRGPLTGDKKRAFFGEITHFIFPSRYIHEAAPLVIYEAMAAGVICVATRKGSIPEQLEGSPRVLTDSADSFVEEALPALANSQTSSVASQECREAYLRALSVSNGQLARFVALLAGRDPDGE
jgi:glycosyltransferase involved in cell wall biosynthesis